jgi:transcriptional regulator with XRE-family HTH domain
MKEFVKTLIEDFADKEYAHSYVNEVSNMEIAAQIKALREQRGLTQKQLAELAGMKQERISALENVDNSSWTAKTLRALAKAFDVSLKISFEEFSTRISDIDSLEDKSCFERESREDSLSNLVKYYEGKGHFVESAANNYLTYVTGPFSSITCVSLTDLKIEYQAAQQSNCKPDHYKTVPPELFMAAS